MTTTAADDETIETETAGGRETATMIEIDRPTVDETAAEKAIGISEGETTPATVSAVDVRVRLTPLLAATVRMVEFRGPR